MVARGKGRIVNITSVGGRVNLPLFGVYDSMKYAVESLSDAMRMAESRPSSRTACRRTTSGRKAG